MGDSSGGTPGPSGLQDLKELLKKTKDKYNLFHPDDKRWPCPFCLEKPKSLFQCKFHIKKDHPSIARNNVEGFIFQEEENQSISCSQVSRNITPPDLTDFLQLINDATPNAQVNNTNTSKTEVSSDFFSLNEYEDDDEEVFYCPYDCKTKKPFQQLRGLNIHIGRMHPGKKKIRREDIEY